MKGLPGLGYYFIRERILTKFLGSCLRLFKETLCRGSVAPGCKIHWIGRENS